MRLVRKVKKTTLAQSDLCLFKQFNQVKSLYITLEPNQNLVINLPEFNLNQKLPLKIYI